LFYFNQILQKAVHGMTRLHLPPWVLEGFFQGVLGYFSRGSQKDFPGGTKTTKFNFSLCHYSIAIG